MSRTLVFHLVSMSVYGAALLAFVAGMGRGGRRARGIGLVLGFGAVLLNLAALIQRGREVGHVPFQAIYEICLLIAVVPLAAYGMVYLLLRFHRSAGVRARVAAGLGALAATMALIAMGGGVWAGDRHLALPPALQSAWFVPHVLVYIVAYGVLGLAALTGLTYLVLHYAVWRGREAEVLPGTAAGLIDEVGYALMAVGFAFLTMGLAFGCLWAQVAWGAWWSWDVKETWALIGWLVYLTYFHLRLLRNWRGARSAWLAFLGGAAILICFVLLEYFPGSSPHKYT